MLEYIPTKGVLLSEKIFAGYPRRPIKRLKADKNLLVDKADTASKCTDSVAKHTNMPIYPFVVVALLTLIKKIQDNLFQHSEMEEYIW